jgi:ribose 1,5-bisphosphokinase
VTDDDDTDDVQAIEGGAFVAVVGPSGAGKDSVMAYARDRLGGLPGFAFMARVITRPCDGASEIHDTMDADAFHAAERDGEFALSWRAHGLAYGIRRDLDARIAAGDVAVANLSRTALGAAARRYRRLAVVEVTALPDILAARIAARGREAGDKVAARLARAAEIRFPGLDVTSLDNSGAIEVAGEAFVALLLALRDAGAESARSDQPTPEDGPDRD